jgi:hypothetical protein
MNIDYMTTPLVEKTKLVDLENEYNDMFSNG